MDTNKPADDWDKSDKAFYQLNILVDLLTARLKNKSFYITITRHSGGYQQPLYATFYLNFPQQIAGSGWVCTESIEEKFLFGTEAIIDKIMSQLNAKYLELKKAVE